MRNLAFRLLIVSVLLLGEGVLLASNQLLAGEQKKSSSQKRPSDAGREIRSLFSTVESALLRGEYGTISKYFAKQVYLSLRGTEDGYYSSNQAYYILQNYFTGHRIIRFRFSTMSDDVSMPYATGGGSTLVHGSSESFQIYVAVGKLEDRWVITQFNVY